MIQIPEILVANSIGMVLMLVVVRHFSRNSRSRLLGDRLFLAMAHLAGSLCLLETGSFLIDGRLFPFARPLNYLLNMLLFVCSIALTYIWTLYTEAKLFGSLAGSRKKAIVLGVPGLIGLAAIATTPLTKAVFSVSPENVYTRSWFVYFLYICTYSYLIYGGINVHLHRRQADRYVFVPVSTFILPIIVGSTVQFFFYGLATQWVSVAVGLISLYVNMQSESMYVDTLSGLYNRLYLDGFLWSECEKRHRKGQLMGLMIDIDHFKQINDQLGHLMGDRAITCAGQALRASIKGYDAFAARYGGDEFVVLARVQHETQAKALMEAVRENARVINETQDNPFALEFSIGMTEFDPQSDTLDTFLTRMDRRMYEMKYKKTARVKST